MKKLFLRITLIFPLLFILGAVINAAPVAAAPTSAHVAADTLYRLDCNPDSHLAVVSDNGANIDCFSGDGTLNVAIYNVTIVCTYHNYGGSFVGYRNRTNTTYVFGLASTWCNDYRSDPVNVVTQLTLQYEAPSV